MVTYIFFELNDERDGLEIEDSIVDSEGDLDNYIIATGFGSIKDTQTGIDEDIYVVSLEK